VRWGVGRSSIDKRGYRRLSFFERAGAAPDIHAPRTSFVALVTAVAAWRLTSPAAWPRIEPAAALAALSHMLMNGFFFNHGLAIGPPCKAKLKVTCG
jgi:hypothetical protein